MRIALAVLALAAGCGGPMYLADHLAAAREEHRPLVVEFYAQWCKPCHVFEERVLPDPRVQQALANVRFVRYDIDTPVGQDAARRCQVTAVPTVVGVDHQGYVRLVKRGTEPTPERFLDFLAEASRVLSDAPRGDSTRQPAP
jgi:thiol:disulfide interchange protein DsbD